MNFEIKKRKTASGVRALNAMPNSIGFKRVMVNGKQRRVMLTIEEELQRQEERELQKIRRGEKWVKKMGMDTQTTSGDLMTTGAITEETAKFAFNRIYREIYSSVQEIVETDEIGRAAMLLMGDLAVVDRFFNPSLEPLPPLTEPPVKPGRRGVENQLTVDEFS